MQEYLEFLPPEGGEKDCDDKGREKERGKRGGISYVMSRLTENEATNDEINYTMSLILRSYHETLTEGMNFGVQMSSYE